MILDLGYFCPCDETTDDTEVVNLVTDRVVSRSYYKRLTYSSTHGYIVYNGCRGTTDPTLLLVPQVSCVLRERRSDLIGTSKV